MKIGKLLNPKKKCPECGQFKTRWIFIDEKSIIVCDNCEAEFESLIGE